MTTNPGDTPAERTAARDGLPVVLMISHELLRVAQGNPTIVSTVNGEKVLVRLPTPDEYLDLFNRAGENLAAEGTPFPDTTMTRDQAENLTKPLPEIRTGVLDHLQTSFGARYRDGNHGR